MERTVSIIGKGAFGSALKRVYENAANTVEFYGREFPKRPDASIILLAVPTSSIEDVISKLDCSADQILILCSKGILKSGAVPSSLLPPGQKFAILSGPGFAQDLSALRPVVHTIASSGSLAAELAERLSTPTFRLYWSNDVIGVQVCGALKNILAIGAGIADGLSWGESARAALISRGVREIRLGLTAMGGDESTIWTPAGIGDLVLTCGSPTSRNFRFGQLIAQNTPPSEALKKLGTVEGYSTLKGFLNGVSRQDVPITAALDDILHHGVAPVEALKKLMSRPVTSA